jgi:hypothetical protein
VTTYITFNEVTIPGTDGDLPELVLDKYNIARGAGVGLVNVDGEVNVAGDGTTVLYHGSTVLLSGTAKEERKGVKYANREAALLGDGNTGTRLLVFRYTVQAGDHSDDLEYLDRFSLRLNGGKILTDTRRSESNQFSLDNGGLVPVYAAVAVNLALPRPGLEPFHPSSRGSSLSYNANIKVDTSPSTVISVNAPGTPDGKYGVGEEIVVTVQFSTPVVVEGDPTLLMETGTTDRTAIFVGMADTAGKDGHQEHDTLEFKYTVRSGDSTQDLTYGDYKTALNIPAGSSILRRSTHSQAHVSLVLPVPGTLGSLSKNRALVVDVAPPTPKLVTTSLANGVYGQGQEVDLFVTFDAPVKVEGIPKLRVGTGSTVLFQGAHLRSVDTADDKRALFFPFDHGLTTENANGFEFLFTSPVIAQTSTSSILIVDYVDGNGIVHMTSDWTYGDVKFVLEETGGVVVVCVCVCVVCLFVFLLFCLLSFCLCLFVVLSFVFCLSSFFSLSLSFCRSVFCFMSYVFVFVFVFDF